MGVAALLVALGGVAGVIGVRNPRRVVLAENCEGGALVGASLDAAHCAHEPVAAGAGVDGH
jgi:hypothetical protein